jgi:transposase
VSKVELYERIRRDRRVDPDVSVRELSRRYRVHRRDVRAALASPVPPSRKTSERASPALGPHEETIRQWLRQDLDAPPKQRHTARRVWQRLVVERGADVGESTVRAFVARARAELALERGHAQGQVTVPQEHPPAAESEVDFGELAASIAGVVVGLYLFVMRLSCSGRAFAYVYAHQAQEAFFDGHVRAFAWFGGVPGRVRYDNLKPAVTRVLRGRDRDENERFTALRSHYGYDAFFCEPGVEGAHEKGGVEGEVGRFRRNHLVPVPDVGSLGELNALIAGCLAGDDERVITGRRETVGAAFAREAVALGVLPAEPFDPAAVLSAKADTKARISVRNALYSVPASLARRRLTVKLHAEHLEVLAPGSDAIVAVHTRSLHKNTQTLELDHYLEILVRKPGALPGATALAQARTTGVFTGLHDEFWQRARAKHGDGDGTRALIDVLLLHRRMPAGAVAAGLRAALRAGATDPAVVSIEGRRWADGYGDDPESRRRRRLADVVPLPDGLPDVDRPAPSLDGYDQLLGANGDTNHGATGADGNAPSDTGAHASTGEVAS